MSENSNDRKPQINRHMNYFPGSGLPMRASIVCKVNDDGTLNLVTFDEMGHLVPAHNVPLITEIGKMPRDRECVMWPPVPPKPREPGQSEPTAPATDPNAKADGGSPAKSDGKKK